MLTTTFDAKTAIGTILAEFPNADIPLAVGLIGKAYRNGVARYGTLTIAHTGYADGTSQYGADTAVYRITGLK